MFPSLFGHERILICLCPGTIGIVDLSENKLVEVTIPEDVMRFGNVNDSDAYALFLQTLLRNHLHPHDTFAIALADGVAFAVGGETAQALVTAEPTGPEVQTMDVPLAPESMVIGGYPGKRYACCRDVVLPILTCAHLIGAEGTIVFPVAAMDPVPHGKNMWKEVGQRFVHEKRTLRKFDFMPNLGPASSGSKGHGGPLSRRWKAMIAGGLVAILVGGSVAWMRFGTPTPHTTVTQSGSTLLNAASSPTPLPPTNNTVRPFSL